MKAKALIISTILLLSINTFASNKIQSSSFIYYQQLIFLYVKVNNCDSLLFLFDTGANTSAIDSKTASILNLTQNEPILVEGSAGTITTPMVNVKSISINNKQVKNLDLTQYDLSGSLAPPNLHLDGILGTDFLKQFAIFIDFENKIISFSKKNQFKLNNCIEFEMDNGIPAFKASLSNNIPTKFRYDSGASLVNAKDIYINITTKDFGEIYKADTTIKPIKVFSATGVGGRIELPVYQINEAKIGSIMLDMPFAIVQPKVGYFSNENAIGFFNNSIFERFGQIVFDFKSGKIYLYNV